MTTILLLPAMVLAQPSEFDLATYPRVDGSTTTNGVSILMVCDYLGVPTVESSAVDYRRKAAMYLRDETTIFVRGYCLLDRESMPPELPRWVADESVPQSYRAARVINAVQGSHRGLPFAVDNLMRGDAELLLVVGELLNEEVERARSEGFSFECVPIARDALVFCVNAENPTAAMTTAQVRRAFERRLVNWESVGGADEPVRPYLPCEGSTCFRIAMAGALRGAALESSDDMLYRSHEDAMAARRGGTAIREDWLAFAVRTDKQGLFINTFQCAGRHSQLNPLAIDGVAPSVDSIRSSEYPYVVTVNAIVRSDLPPESGARQLREWLLSPAGQEALEKCGFVPITACEGASERGDG